ncbi:helix-turn-helix domain-containing protein [Mycobacteroides abscessus]|uniref:helix-turn-helix domain-containing protein n=1 Tax=Mycobacteroides abscessus TaxID=36809 RepID=UPI000929D437|nr:XRE family transcriptional regulator [Mycobacteroides abscessus]MBN7379713.1 XRE family transcriptional regulator [Mycobacteroides abscessus subsp. massiliense]MDM2096379.1 XRE family transcriptional regulator [Mycobacteroides abscessus]MDM2121110.1 XRE family transcriptional regulator [Mycobacteroides abscessus]MDM2124395.1 XRE family transcriptional regulator [Mycobacteroides abscessus]MDM2130580.1 XRE family transcriptional regulator [Mycobacteroides abscessus]
MLSPSRLRIARKRRGLTLTSLAAKADISTRSLSAYENGHQEPSDETLDCLAQALQVAPSFLKASDIEEIPLDAVSFRALSKMTARQRDRALASGRIAVEINGWIEARFTLPRPDVPVLAGHDPEVAAEMLRARWGLGVAPIRNMLHLLEAHGVRVYSLTGENAELDAFALRWHGQPYVFLNTMKSAERGRFDAAHECGHLVLHGGCQFPHDPQAEAEADRFASAFLMPGDSVLAQGLREATVDRILKAKRYWNVSAMALTRRLSDLGLLTEWGYRSACVQLSKMGYRSSEPDGLQRESSQLLAKVFAALREDRKRPSAIAEDLGLTVEDLLSHVFGLTMLAVTRPAATDEHGELSNEALACGWSATNAMQASFTPTPLRSIGPSRTSTPPPA